MKDPSGHAHPHRHEPPQHHHHKYSPTRREFVASLVAAGILAPSAVALGLTSDSTAEMAANFRKLSEDYEAKGLAEGFRGITTNGQIVPDLFHISPTGVSTEP